MGRIYYICGTRTLWRCCRARPIRSSWSSPSQLPGKTRPPGRITSNPRKIIIWSECRKKISLVITPLILCYFLSIVILSIFGIEMNLFIYYLINVTWLYNLSCNYEILYSEFLFMLHFILNYIYFFVNIPFLLHVKWFQQRLEENSK